MASRSTNKPASAAKSTGRGSPARVAQRATTARSWSVSKLVNGERPSSSDLQRSSLGGVERPLGLSEEDIKLHKKALIEMALYDQLVAICAKYFVRIDSVLSTERTTQVSKARAACCVHLRALGMSYPEIGKALLRDHTTIIKLVRSTKKEGPDGDPTPSPTQT